MEIKVTVGAGITLNLPNMVNYFKYNYNIEYPIQIKEDSTHKENFKELKKIEMALNKVVSRKLQEVINNPEKFVGEENVKERFDTDTDF